MAHSWVLRKAGVGDQEQVGLPPPPPPAAQSPGSALGLCGSGGEGWGCRLGSRRLGCPADRDSLAPACWCTEVRGTMRVARSRLTREPLPAGTALPVAGTAPGDRACRGEQAIDGRGGGPGSGPPLQTGFQGRHAVGLHVRPPEPLLLISAWGPSDSRRRGLEGRPLAERVRGVRGGGGSGRPVGRAVFRGPQIL